MLVSSAVEIGFSLGLPHAVIAIALFLQQLINLALYTSIKTSFIYKNYNNVFTPFSVDRTPPQNFKVDFLPLSGSSSLSANVSWSPNNTDNPITKYYLHINATGGTEGDDHHQLYWLDGTVSVMM